MVAQTNRHRRMGLDVIQLGDDVSCTMPLTLSVSLAQVFFSTPLSRHRHSVASETPPASAQGTDRWRLAFIAPQLEWPQITISVTPSATTAYSMVAETPPGSGPKDGTIFPALRMTKSCPGSCWVTSFRHQTAVRTGDEKRFGILAGGQAAEEFFTLGEDLFLEVEEALNDMLHSSVSSL